MKVMDFVAMKEGIYAVVSKEADGDFCVKISDELSEDTLKKIGNIFQNTANNLNKDKYNELQPLRDEANKFIEEFGLPQKRIAEMIGISQTNLSAFLTSGKNTITQEQAMRLKSFMNEYNKRMADFSY